MFEAFSCYNYLIIDQSRILYFRISVSHCHIWAVTWDFQRCGMCDQQSLRSACAYAQSNQSPCWSPEYSMSVKLLTELHLEFLSLKGGCTGSFESALVKITLCWKSHVAAHFYLLARCLKSDRARYKTKWRHSNYLPNVSKRLFLITVLWKYFGVWKRNKRIPHAISKRWAFFPIVFWLFITTTTTTTTDIGFEAR